ncbi:DUF1524 domain-containing protein [Pseudactinotalea sp. HY160]|uniref:HNH endonuclease family protein n=1 Tax=Pseudactinotalea sp. HY160 TaxID=2654490 RepID=UPI00128D1B76|nr:HNH endonuclease family protein [Pseudactinotalea sp. HY160]MPV49089.1 DUF1524 domain-containing protein [Pseudactinotalea sp. HY160]
MAQESRSGARTAGTVIAAALLACALALVIPRWWMLVRPHGVTPVAQEQLAVAEEALGRLPVVVPLDLDDYERDFFGPAWQDPDGAVCDTRNRVLAAWLEDVTVDPSNPCLVDSGWFVDPYTGAMLMFERGPRTSREVQIDHLIALADAWRKGAHAWPRGRAQRFANDVSNLIPTDGAANQAKGAADASGWLPPARGYRCAYVVQQILVKEAYGLGVSSEEVGAMGEELRDCPVASGPTPAPVSVAGGSASGGAAGRRSGSVGTSRGSCRGGSRATARSTSLRGPRARGGRVSRHGGTRRGGGRGRGRVGRAGYVVSTPRTDPGPQRSGKQRHRVRTRPDAGAHRRRPCGGVRVRSPPPGGGTA